MEGRENKSLFRIVVLGAGAVGLSTAVQIQDKLNYLIEQDSGINWAFSMTLIADKFLLDTTSDGAAGIFQVGSNLIPGVQQDRAKEWFRNSFEFFSSLVLTPEAPKIGLQLVSGYQFYDKDPFEMDSMKEEFYFHYRKCTDQEMQMFPAIKNAHYGEFFTTLMVEGRWFLPWLLNRFKSNGGVVEERQIGSLKDLSEYNYDVIVNCTGLGSNSILGLPNDVIPVRGQVIRVTAPWIKHFVFVDAYYMYIIPGKETCIIGGTCQRGNFCLDVNKEDKDRIWKNACSIYPPLENAIYEWDWVGLRPYREPVRVEKESLVVNNKPMHVVHNYGHGGNGMALSWGTGTNAAELVISYLNDMIKNIK